MTGEPQRILVLEAGGIGDAILASPALDALRERFPGARIAAIATPRAAPVLESLDLGIELPTLRLARKLGRLLDAARLVLAARARRPDLLIDLSSIETDAAARRRRALVALIGARRSIGRNTDGRGTFFDDAMAESLFDDEHEISRKLRVLASLDIAVEEPEPRIGVSDAARARARRRLRESGLDDHGECIGVHPGAFLPTRRWPADRFARLVADLAEASPRRRFLVTGGTREAELVDRVARAAPDRAVRAVAPPLPELAALVGRCRLVVTNDTAMTHVAAAQHVPVVAIFGRTNLAR
ncbi:MAG: glycosyltransferase family 9 protein, partial [Planctomycetota bacterium]